MQVCWCAFVFIEASGQWLPREAGEVADFSGEEFVVCYDLDLRFEHVVRLDKMVPTPWKLEERKD